MRKLSFPTQLVGNNDFHITGVALAYLAAAYLGMWFAFPGIGNYPVWPPAGVALALVLLLGYRVWPGILIGSLITFSVVFITQGVQMDATAVGVIAGIAVANVAEVLLGKWLYDRLIREVNTPFEKTADTFKFLVITLVIALVGSAAYTVGVNAMLLNTHFLGRQLLYNYLAEASGMWLFAGLLLALTRGKTHWRANLFNLAEAFFFTLAVAFLLFVMYSYQLPESMERSFPFLILPFMLWVAFRSSVQAVTVVVLVIAMFAIYITINGSGPFVLSDAQHSLLLLQLFIMVVAITTVVLSAAVFERGEARTKLEKFNENLEGLVKARTKALDDEIKMRRKTEQKIRISNNQLRKTNEELDNFVYKVSHDLRAPISSILGLVNIAKKDNSLPNMLACIEQIEKSAKTQDNFIKDIIELTKNARVKPRWEKIDFNRLVDETFETLRYSMHNVPPKPKLHIEQKKEFYSDANRMKVIFNNVLSNAIKYSPPERTEIDINVKVLNGHAKIAIADKGNGIEEKYQQDVFKMFYRATDQNAGSGLGLYIVKETVAKLKGDVRLDSRPGQGTVVHLKLPNMAPNRRRRTSKV